MMKSHSVYTVIFCFLTALAVALPLSATSIVLPTDDQLVAKSPVIVRGRVMQTFPIDRNGGIWTETHVAVDEVIKGENVESTIVIREIGGEMDGRLSVVFGSPEYKAGEKVLLFLWPTGRGDYQTRDLFVGKFTERYTRDGKRLWHRNNEHVGTALFDSAFNPIEGNNIQREADGFERFVEAKIGGVANPDENYGVDSPELAPTSTGGISANFTLIGEPTIYRWFVFDSGGSAPWRSVGSQIGYSGGGVSELQTAMASWTGYAQARINYTYAGASTSAPGGLGAPNGINEVVFNDPQGEIDGSFNPKTGGVIGRGGFNRTQAGGAWTSPFAADESHPARTYSTTWNITEGNLVIQDGVSPTNGISSAVFAELIAHEFGHTLGFGHSSDSTALMYASITGRGPALRTDDQLAARWLYPGSGGGTNPPPTTGSAPAAPSNTSASALSATQMQITWRDNASNETSQTVHLAAGNGAFSRVVDVGANVTATTLGNLIAGQSYRVYVTARNSYGESTASNTSQLTMPLQASFTVSPSSQIGTAGITPFTFTDSSGQYVSSRQWNFGDGTTSTDGQIAHVFYAAGTYTVQLTVWNSAGQSSSTTKAISVSAPVGLVASFSYSPANPTTEQTIQFSDQSSGSPTSWSWTFGDGTTSTLRNPTKRFASPGSYPVELTIGNGSTTQKTSRTVTVTSPSPITPNIATDFDFSPASPIAGQPVAFNDRSSGSPTAWSWSFGNGATSSAQNPTYTFAAPGTYQVTLNSSNSGSSGTRTKSVIVRSTSGVFNSLIPVSADTSGVGGTEWQTELSIYNAGNLAANVEFTYLPGAGGSVVRRSIVLSSGAAMTYANALRQIFGLTSGAGAIGVNATNSYGTPELKISSRTYTTSAIGTYGQFVPDVEGESIPTSLYLTGIESNDSFRTNIGLVNKEAFGVNASLTLYSSSGAVLATRTMTLAANNFLQQPLTTVFSGVAGQNLSGLSMRIASSSPNAVSGYASVVDNRSQDPVFIPAQPAGTAGDLYIPVVGRTAGGGTTFWRSDLMMHNPNSSTVSIGIRYLAANADNRSAQARYVSVGAGQTATIHDILLWLGLQTGSGALQITWSGGSLQPVITSRTYTTRVTDGGTYGQSIDAAAASTFGSDAFVTGLKSNASYRTNVGFVNSADQAISVEVTVYAESGQTLATKSIVIPAKSQTQSALSALFSGYNVASIGNFTLRARSLSGPSLFAYGSVVDNLSGDPIFVAGE